MKQYKYCFEKYTGPASRHKCPGCGHAGTFVHYVHIVTNEPVSPIVGRCNREIKCGYHLTPKQFFADNPQARSQMESIPIPAEFRMPAADGDSYDIIDDKYVTEAQSLHNDFIRSFWRIFPKDTVYGQSMIKVAEEYKVGALSNGAVLFWQIDKNGKVRTAKCMKYNISTGRRLSRMNWMHSILKKQRRLPEGFKLQQCFAGEHLLDKYPNKPVAIVEAYSTALYLAALIDEYVWLAADCLQGLTLKKCRALSGRVVILFPDLDGYGLWERRAEEISKEINCYVEVSDYLKSRKGFISDSADLRDVMMKYAEHGLPLEDLRRQILKDTPEIIMDSREIDSMPDEVQSYARSVYDTINRTHNKWRRARNG